MKKLGYLLMVMIFIVLCLSACSHEKTMEPRATQKDEKGVEVKDETPLPKTAQETPKAEEQTKRKITKVNWSEYFHGLKGAAVVYDVSDGQYMIYNNKLASKRRSPCSTFKIISSLIGLEKGVIPYDNSVRNWSGEVFWNESWNKDIGFQDAFSTSCVWYFRQVIDELGKKTMQEELDRLQYGNCDISDWKGKLNTNNNNRALTGFWIESSLKISAKEQVEVMERIFEKQVFYQSKALHVLKDAMKVQDQKDLQMPFYGKTGTGKKNGILVDAWFTGFAKSSHGNIYFCVYLGRSDGMNVSSSIAKEIAIQLVSDYCKDGKR